VLKNPSGAPVNLSALNYESLYNLYGSRFDPVSHSWVQNSPEQHSEFSAIILDPLAKGTYTVEFSMENEQALIETINFDLSLDLPIVSSRTFQINTDSAGNIHWTWNVPKQLIMLAKTYDLQIRAGVAAIKEGRLISLYWPNVPIEMGYSLTPSSIYQNLTESADEIKFAFQVRTNNNNARAYSDRVILKDNFYPVSIVPAKTEDFFIIPVRAREKLR
jgi:hypothetical protein